MDTTASKSPVVLLWGESDFLLRLAAAEALGGVRPTEIDAADWRPGATGDLATPSLFGEPRALLVSNAQHLGKEGLAEVADEVTVRLVYIGLQSPVR